eukprot:212920_1
MNCASSLPSTSVLPPSRPPPFARCHQTSVRASVQAAAADAVFAWCGRPSNRGWGGAAPECRGDGDPLFLQPLDPNVLHVEFDLVVQLHGIVAKLAAARLQTS